ncbi:MAG: hypothetical protein ACFFB4_07585 [Promethearchaeota archaeon]
MSVRQINDFEKKIISNSLSQISNKFTVLLGENRYYLNVILNQESKKNQIPVYLIHEKLNLFKQIVNFPNIYSLGLYFGFIKKGVFFLSLEGAEFLYKENYISKKCQLIVNEEGEKAILYGNNVLKKMILSFPLEIKINRIVIILNEIKELLAIGLNKIDGNYFNKFHSEDLIVANLVDKGYYLRKEN